MNTESIIPPKSEMDSTLYDQNFFISKEGDESDGSTDEYKFTDSIEEPSTDEAGNQDSIMTDTQKQSSKTLNEDITVYKESTLLKGGNNMNTESTISLKSEMDHTMDQSSFMTKEGDESDGLTDESKFTVTMSDKGLETESIANQ